jgi:hypothetical protein
MDIAFHVQGQAYLITSFNAERRNGDQSDKSRIKEDVRAGIAASQLLSAFIPLITVTPYETVLPTNP